MREEGQALPGWREPGQETDQLAGIHRELRELNRKQDSIMAAVDDLNTALDGFGTELTTFLADVATEISGGVTADQAAAVVAKINGFTAQLQGADPANPVPPAPTA